MPNARRNPGRHPSDEGAFTVKARKPVPFEFVLDALARVAPTTRLMFGCLALYLEEKIVLILRDRQDFPRDNGVWLATTAEHHESLQREFPAMRSIELFGKQTTSWQVLPVDAPDFEETARRACALIIAGDPHIGKIPSRRKKSKVLKKKR